MKTPPPLLAQRRKNSGDKRAAYVVYVLLEFKGSKGTCTAHGARTQPAELKLGPRKEKKRNLLIFYLCSQCEEGCVGPPV